VGELLSAFRVPGFVLVRHFLSPQPFGAKKKRKLPPPTPPPTTQKKQHKTACPYNAIRTFVPSATSPAASPPCWLHARTQLFCSSDASTVILPRGISLLFFFASRGRGGKQARQNR